MIVIFVESPLFSAWRRKYLNDEGFRKLQIELLYQPTRGVLIQHSGGLRKLRVAAESRGKRGGNRLIYFYQAEDSRIYLLYAYAKSEQADLTPQQLRMLRAAMEDELI